MKSLLFMVVALCLCRPVFAAQELTLGVLPFLPANELIKKFTPLANYLSSQIGMKVIVKVGSSFDEHIKYIGMNKLDIAFMGPNPYISMVNRYGKKPLLARLEVNGRNDFCGYIVVRRDSPVKTLKDLKGKTFAYGMLMSTMSYILPHYALMQAGVDDADLKGYDFLGSHKNVALALLAGDYDAGGVKPEVYRAYKHLGLRKIAETQRVPEHVFVTRTNFPKKLFNKIQSVFLSISKSPEGMKALRKINNKADGMVSVKDSDFDGLRAVMKKISLMDKRKKITIK